MTPTKPDSATIQEIVQKTSFRSFTIKASASIEVPNNAYVDYDEIADLDNYFAFADDLKGRSRNDIGKIYGYPDGDQDDAEMEAALEIVTGERYTHKDETLTS